MKSPRLSKGRRVLVTGGAGFIGYSLAQKLAHDGARVFVLDIQRALPDFEIFHGTRKRISYIRGSVTSRKTIERILREHKIQTVFHLAAESIVSRSRANPLHVLETNITGTWMLLEAVRNQKRMPDVIIASSDKAYGSQAVLPYREDAPLQGNNPYDASKSCADLIAQMYAHTYELPLAIARCGNVYGPGDTNWTRLVPDAFRSLSRGATLKIRSDGTFVRDYIYIDDVVSAYITLANHIASRKVRAEAFNFGNNKPLSVMSVLKHIRSIAPMLKYTIVANARNEIKDQYLNSKKAERVLKWKAHVPFAHGISKAAAWYAEYCA